jgi:hypothetical protein
MKNGRTKVKERERETDPNGLIGRGFFREDMHGGCSLVVA